jgi:steroid delta-isomerase-like uncharacterized protein
MSARVSRIVLVGFLLAALGGVFQANAQTNKEIVQRVADEIWNQGNLDAADELFATDFVNHDPNPGGATDLAGYKEGVLTWRASFPDYHLEVHDLVAAGDRVASRYTVTGTHQGELLGIPATGIQVTMTGIDDHRLAGGRIVEVRRCYDMLGLLQQMGYYPPMPDMPLPMLNRTHPEDFPWGEPSSVTGDPGDPEANKELCAREVEEGWNQGDATVLLELFAPTYVNHDPFWPEITDYESYVQWAEAYTNPDEPSDMVIGDMFAEGDKVIEHWAPGPGIFETYIVPSITLYRCADGKIVETWFTRNAVPIFIDRGLLPPLPAFTSVECRTWGQIKSLSQE